MGDTSNYHLGPPTLDDQQTGHYNLSMLYCGFFVVMTAGLLLAIYHCLATNCRCTEYPSTWLQNSEDGGTDQNFKGRKVIVLDSNLFKYKGRNHQEEGSSDCSEECVVCLSVFEAGEDVRQLVRCKHSFHAPCIDMWLFSHFDCPICRAPVGVRASGSGAAGSENLGAEFSDSGVLPV